MNGSTATITLAAAVGTGVMAGVWVTFSSFVMPALDRLPPGESISAMQVINNVAVTPPLMTIMFGTAALQTAVAVSAVRSWEQPAATWLLAGSALYLIGSVVVTVVGNVPLNDALAAVDARSASANRDWSSFHGGWSLWNHVRSVTAVAATGLTTLGAASGVKCG